MISNIRISNLILKKSKKSFFRISITFSLVWIIILSYIFFCVFYSFSNIQNFYKNDMAHVIEVKGRVEKSKYEKLVVDDLTYIYNLLKSNEIEYNSIPICKIASGIIDEETQKGIILYGIMEDGMLGVNDEHNALFSNIEREKIRLIIPKISIDLMGNISSSQFNVSEFKIEPIDSFIIENIIRNNQMNIDTFFCNKSTYTYIVENMYNNALKETEFEELVIYITNLNNVTTVKMMLEKNSYFVSYAFNAFEELPLFITKSSVLLLLVFFVLIILSMIYIFISYKNHINVQKKDIGVIKHFGYKVDTIRNIYLWPLKVITMTLIVISYAFNFIIYEEVLISVIVSTGMMVLAYVMYNMIKYGIIDKMVKKDVLELLKYDKEFE